ncbi:hypothetical protein AAL_02900 [Moelleriella libera RCEF 2490]|uniref:Uncharacterized protein n=1 Tax=Moelleriella libera RCEF 2490 TaxID=1081109 RepID=A0A162IU18_9HYPO|nr:hypothetical protein AAL_02900 [Moelleriella libera RCEF 2490]
MNLKRQRGKHWTLEEEEFFWQTIVPVSPKGPKRPGSKTEGAKTWRECGEAMQQQFGHKHRTYTAATLFEHYFQNMRQRPSPRAHRFIETHKRLLGCIDEAETGQQSKRQHSESERTEPDEPDAAARGPAEATQYGTPKRARLCLIPRKPVPNASREA